MTIISVGNMKIGPVPNVSLPPVKACIKNPPCARECYAQKAYRLYPTAKAAWDKNLELCRRSRQQYFGDIATHLERHSSKLFRWHVAGDILDWYYLKRMMTIAEQFPDTQFLAFTKRHALLQRALGSVPENLVLHASMWPGWGDLAVVAGYPKHWLQTKDGWETRCPDDAFLCPGSCPECQYRCWYRQDMNVITLKH